MNGRALNAECTCSSATVDGAPAQGSSNSMYMCITWINAKGILHLFLICHALPVTPGDDEDFATRLADSCKLTDELGFIWHVLTALH